MTDREKIRYIFGHLVSSYQIHAHSGDSGELADDEMIRLGLSEETTEIMHQLAQHVQANYTYHGEQELEDRP